MFCEESHPRYPGHRREAGSDADQHNSVIYLKRVAQVFLKILQQRLR